MTYNLMTRQTGNCLMSIDFGSQNSRIKYYFFQVKLVNYTCAPINIHRSTLQSSGIPIGIRTTSRLKSKRQKVVYDQSSSKKEKRKRNWVLVKSKLVFYILGANNYTSCHFLNYHRFSSAGRDQWIDNINRTKNKYIKNFSLKKH